MSLDSRRPEIAAADASAFRRISTAEQLRPAYPLVACRCPVIAVAIRRLQT